jgi:hypothetical protein
MKLIDIIFAALGKSRNSPIQGSDVSMPREISPQSKMEMIVVNLLEEVGQKLNEGLRKTAKVSVYQESRAWGTMFDESQVLGIDGTIRVPYIFTWVKQDKLGFYVVVDHDPELYFVGDVAKDFRTNLRDKGIRQMTLSDYEQGGSPKGALVALNGGRS